MLRSMAAMSLLIAAPLVAQQKTDPQAEIIAVVNDGAAGWNAGDLDRFAAIYAPDAIFVGAQGLVSSRDAIVAYYRGHYMADGKLHGKLAFQVAAFRRLSAVHAILWARYTLADAEPGKPPATGLATLVFERRPDGWKIISDHPS